MLFDVAFSGENGKANPLASKKKDAFARHIAACNSARLPGERIRFLLEGGATRVDFLAKYVRSDKVDGCLLPENTGRPAVWNWRPEK